MSTQFGTASNIYFPDSTSEVVAYIKRRLGAPVIEINVADEQIYDRIGDALKFMVDYNEDFIEKGYVSHIVTDDDMVNKWFPVANTVFEVIRVLPVTNIDKNIMTDITYNMRHSINFSEFMRSAYTGFISEYQLMQMKIQEIGDLFMGNKSIQFNRYQDKLYWKGNIEDQFQVGDYIVYECYSIVDPGVYGRIFGDRRFLSLATAYTKALWGEILTKFVDVPLFGGIKMNGNAILQQGNADIQKAEQDIVDSGWKAMDFVG